MFIREHFLGWEAWLQLVSATLYESNCEWAMLPTSSKILLLAAQTYFVGLLSPSLNRRKEGRKQCSLLILRFLPFPFFPSIFLSFSSYWCYYNPKLMTKTNKVSSGSKRLNLRARLRKMQIQIMCATFQARKVVEKMAKKIPLLRSAWFATWAWDWRCSPVIATSVRLDLVDILR